MALQNDTSRIQYNGNGSTTNSYVIPFVFFENSHVRAVVTTSAGVDTELTLGSGFTVTGAGNQNGGSLTTTTAVPGTSKVTIYRSVPVTQTTSYQEGGDFPAASHERALDKLTMIAQQTKRVADRALKVPESQNNPNDLPNAGTGKKLLGSDNGTLTWEENRQLPAYPGNAGQKFLAAPGGGNSPQWQDAPSIAVGPITATNTITPRYLADRFIDYINVKDFGAVGNGVTDDWLAIQRAIYAASAPVPPSDASTITANDTYMWGNKLVPKMIVAVGHKPVFFPPGTYRVSRSIIINGHTLIGSHQGITRITCSLGSQFPLMVDKDFAINEIISLSNDPSPWSNAAAVGFNMNVQISNLSFELPWLAGQTIQKMYCLWPIVSHDYDKGSGAIGSNSVTTNWRALSFKVGSKFKFHNHNTVYTVTSNDGSTIVNITPALTQSASNTPILREFNAGNGIITCGGENAHISSCYFNSFTGAGIFQTGGSPGVVIDNCMANNNDVAYWIEAAPTLLLKPSGDGNNTFIRSGHLHNFSMVTVICPKIEDYREYNQATAFFGANLPYARAKGNRRAVFEINSGPTGTPSYFEVNGGSLNASNGTWQSGQNPLTLDETGDNDTRTLPLFDSWESGSSVRLRVNNFRQIGFGGVFLRSKFATNNTVYKEVRRNDQDHNDFSLYHHLLGDLLSYTGANAHILLHGRDAGGRATTQTGIHYDLCDGVSSSGMMPNKISFTRSGTTLTAIYLQADGTGTAPHNLQVGDYVLPLNVKNTTPPNQGIRADEGGAPNKPNGYWTGAMRIQSRTDTTFTCLVQNSGAEAGEARINVMKFPRFHVLENGEHRMQTPRMTGGAFGIFDYEMNRIAGLTVPVASEGNWWTSKELSVGGTIESPAFRLLHGTGAPSISISAPNGSLYMRTDGDSSTTLYVRSQSTWKPLASYEP